MQFINLQSWNGYMQAGIRLERETLGHWRNEKKYKERTREELPLSYSQCEEQGA